MKHVTEGKIHRGIKVTGKRREDLSSYWMTLRKRKYTGNCMRKHQIAMCAELALEEATDLS
jgi:hypothetical protein